MPRRKKAEVEEIPTLSPEELSKTQVIENAGKAKNETVRTAPGSHVDEYLVYVDGQQYWWTSSSIEVMLQRNRGMKDTRLKKDIQFPEGSQYVIPEYLREGCKGCG